MKIQTSKHQLHSATAGMLASLSDKTLAWTALKTDGDGQVLLTASDWLLSVYHRIDGEVAEAGECFVPSRLFADVVRELPEGAIQLETSDTVLVVTAGTADEFYFKIPLIEDGVWPEPFALQNEKKMSFSAVELSYMIEQVLPSIVTESTRHFATVGCFHKTEEGYLRLVGSDGIRLSYCEMKAEGDAQQFPDNVCLPRRGLSELARMCGDEGGENISLYVIRDNTILAAESSRRQVFIRLAAVDYPRYFGSLPADETQLKSKAERVAMQTVIRRALLAADSTRVVRMRFSKNRLLMSAHSSSECQEALPLENSLDKSYKIDMNGKFMLDILATMTSDNVWVSFQGNDSPFTIVPEIELPACRSRHVIPPIQEER